jgi:hypothetical protein
MALFGSGPKTESIALIDIDSTSIGAAVSVHTKGSLPTLIYTNRISIQRRDHEEHVDAMLRVLAEISDDLVIRGSPIVRQQTGSGRISRIIASIGAPWQKTLVRVQSVSKTKPFAFTHALLSELVQKAVDVPEGYEKYDESVISTMLNGYDIPHPFGKHALRADIVILSSLLEKEAATKVEKLLRKTYHTHALTLTAFAPIAYSLLRNLFIHEKDFLVLHISGESTDVAFMKQGQLVDTLSSEQGIQGLERLVQDKANKSHVGALIDAARNGTYESSVREAEKEWLTMIRSTLSSLAEHHPLPRTVFLLADAGSRMYLAQLLDAPEIRSLWLSDDPLRIVPIQPSHLAPFIQVRGEAEGDISLGLLGLFANRNTH